MFFHPSLWVLWRGAAWGSPRLFTSGPDPAWRARPHRRSGRSQPASVLRGQVHRLAQARYDQGPADPAMELRYVTVFLQPAAGLEAFLGAQRPNNKLAPEDFADRFGLSQNDIGKVTGWLGSQGLRVKQWSSFARLRWFQLRIARHCSLRDHGRIAHAFAQGARPGNRYHRRAGGKRVPVIAGTGSNNTEEAIALTSHAKKAGADAVLMISPYYNRPTQEGIYRHFEKVAKAVDVPIVLYNIPGRTASNIEPTTIERLSRIDNIIGVKEASGSMKQITDIISLCGDDFTVVSGEDYLTFPLLCVGGKGVISVVSNVAPRDMADLCNIFFEGKIQEARRLYYKLLPLLHGLFIEPNPVPVKAALAMMKKIESEEVRLPLVAMSAGNKEHLRKILEGQGLLPEEGQSVKR